MVGARAANLLIRYIAGNVQKLRDERGLAQEQLAERADMHVTYLRKLERGSVNPSVRSLVAVAEALEVPLESLFLPSIRRPPRAGRPPRNPKPTG
ncbi:MAG: helix-turn-helix transcriptional regulator [Myxococcaceae bacterium]|nr:helix-turn-helix transcriptional regulator [Myxococcaceae bacterium]